MKARYLIALHLLLFLYSFAVVLCKLASSAEFLSFEFFALFGGMFVLLALYAVFWQQILKKIPLITAYTNKAVTVIWGLVWGIFIFGEELTVKKVVGVLIVGLGIVLYSRGTRYEQE